MIIKFIDQITIYNLIIIFLVTLYILGAVNFGPMVILMQLTPPVLGAVIAGSIFDYLEYKEWVKPTTPLISGLIIGLVAQFGEEATPLFMMGVIAMFIKFAIKLFSRHIFNPAASGLLLGTLIFSSAPSWWAGGQSGIFFLWIPLLLYKFRRWAPMAGFIIPTVLLSGVNILFSTSLLFFISVMLIEPITSPSKVKHGLVYGVLVALLYFYLSGQFSSPDPLIVSLLIGNLGGRLLEKILV